MADLPRQQKEYFQRIKQALGTGDEDAYADLVRQKNPLAIRQDLSTTLGQHVRENYDSPLNAFEDKKLIENIPIEYTNLPSNIAGKFDAPEGKIILPKVVEGMENRQTGTLLHELGHAQDVSKGITTSEKFDPRFLKQLGAEASENAFGKHHTAGFFEKEALMKLLQNKKLEMALPLMKAAGIGALGASVVGIGNKAMAGDVGGAGLDTADLATDMIPLVGEIKMAGTPSELGSGELPPEEMENRQRFNQVQKRLLNK